MRILRMLMHLSMGHVTAAGKIPPPDSPPNWTYGTGRTHVGLCPKFLVANCLLTAQAAPVGAHPPYGKSSYY